MLPLMVKLLVSLTFFTAVYLTTEAAKSNTCRANAATLPTIPGLPGKDGRPGHNGTDGEQGPPGSDSCYMILQKCCNLLSEHVATSCQVPSTAISTTSQTNTPTEFVPNPLPHFNPLQALNHCVNTLLPPAKNCTSAILHSLQDTTTSPHHRERKECTVT